MKLTPEMIAAIETALQVGATAVNPVAGAAVAAVETAANAAFSLTPGPSATATAAPPPVAAAVPSDLSALTAQIAELKALFAAQSASLSAAAPGAASTHVDSQPGPGVQPYVTDPNAHPILVAAGRAPMVPPPVPAGPLDETPGAVSLSTVIAVVNKVSAKLDALVEATGQGGSAAMAAHE